jgi:predicted N-acetyltransferase YhbS
MSFDSSSAGVEGRFRTENIENTAELRAIRAVNHAAFGESEEADLVDKLRADGSALISRG